MNVVDFWKVEGLGNHFVLLDERNHSENAAHVSLETKKNWCTAKTSIGADGILTLLPVEEDDSEKKALAKMGVVNADGSEPEMCGNGLRCVFRWLFEKGELVEGEWGKVETGAGVLSGRILGETIEVEMGDAHLGKGEVSLTLQKDLWALGNEKNAVDKKESFVGREVSVGNPHFVLLKEEAEISVAAHLGPYLEHHLQFPNRANIEFSEINGCDVNLVVWERGVGITQACGTGACAAVAAWVERGRLPAEKNIRVHLPGGSLSVFVGPVIEKNKLKTRALRLTGPARIVFSGKVQI